MVKTNILNADYHLLSKECYDRGYYKRKYHYHRTYKHGRNSVAWRASKRYYKRARKTLFKNLKHQLI